MSDVNNLINSLLQLPGMRVMHFTKDGALSKKLIEFCKSSEFDSEYLILTFNQEKLDSLKVYENSFCKVKYVNPKRPKYHIQSKQYDYLFIEDLPEDRLSFFKKVYSALKNAAPLFIFLPKDKRNFAYKIEKELIESNYVASNLIDLDDYLIVSSKKMHGWSGS